MVQGEKMSGITIIRLISVVAGCAVIPILQGQEARLSGTVTDPTGAVLPDVTITATQTRQTISFKAKTDSEGQYLFPRLPIGPYEVKAEASGFKTFVQSGLDLTTSADARLNVK